MRKMLFALALGAATLGFGTAAQAGHGYGQGCCPQQSCQPSCCQHQQVCEPQYRWETVKVFAGYRQDCYGCSHPVYRYERRQVYAGQKCRTVCGGGCNQGHGYGYGQPAYSY